MTDINIEQCTATFHFEPHYESCPDRFFLISGAARHPTHGEVAKLSGYLIKNRAAWKAAGEFGSIMEAETQELYDYSLSIFNNRIIVHPWLLDGGPRSGSGCWGEELNEGNIVYLQDLSVAKPFTRRGVGSWFLEEFLHSPRVNVAASHVYTWPFPNNAARVKPTPQSIADIASFFQKNHFRRIGRTVFFCYSVNPAHPSRTLAIADDATAFASDFPNMEQDIINLESQFPLHYAIDGDRTAGVRDSIMKAYALDRNIIHQKGPDGYSPVHLAAKKRNVHALRTLL
ncbi:hypothetical protein HYPSUDRAFT_44734, partial [Hypholoma sublateritium FD-334 SS-4]